MASTFNGVTFTSVRSGDGQSMAQAQAEVAETHIPGSNINILDIGGLRAKRITRRIRVAHADAATVETTYANFIIGELILIGSSLGSAMIEQLSEHDTDIEGSFDFFTVQWVLVS